MYVDVEHPDGWFAERSKTVTGEPLFIGGRGCEMCGPNVASRDWEEYKSLLGNCMQEAMNLD